MSVLTELINLIKKPATMHYPSIPHTKMEARGIPVPVDMNHCNSCKACENICPTKAIHFRKEKSLEIDYGKCTLCGFCIDTCETSTLKDSSIVSVFSLQREALVYTYDSNGFNTTEDTAADKQKSFQNLVKKKGFVFREVAASGNNTVEMEMNASFNNVFDMESEGIRACASPKHADAILYSGPIGKNMQIPLQKAWDCLVKPKLLIAVGTEAASGGLFEKNEISESPGLYIIGDPPPPYVIIQALRYLQGKLDYSLSKEISEFINKEQIKGAKQ
ncbi:MAG: 4Fe-4S binding protein [Leptospiraceae bacterium]|nr:4Fe-4S binding protein [Leptospiraceae bacterium]MCP5500095.1 4Fe-4S binding protein [Leptospiraceae bacterium]